MTYVIITLNHVIYKKSFLIDNEELKEFVIDVQPKINFAFGGAHSIHKKTIKGGIAWDIDIQSAYPNIILNNVNYDDVHIPKYFKFSDSHAYKLKKFISDYRRK